MKLPQEIIIKPIITEKSMRNTAEKKYTFKVDKTAGKIEIAKAVEQLFSVEVAKVNTMRVPGQRRRRGMVYGYTADWKKAVVTLTPKSKGIEFFESMT